MKRIAVATMRSVALSIKYWRIRSGLAETHLLPTWSTILWPPRPVPGLALRPLQIYFWKRIQSVFPRTERKMTQTLKRSAGVWTLEPCGQAATRSPVSRHGSCLPAKWVQSWQSQTASGFIVVLDLQAGKKWDKYFLPLPFWWNLVRALPGI